MIVRCDIRVKSGQDQEPSWSTGHMSSSNLCDEILTSNNRQTEIKDFYMFQIDYGRWLVILDWAAPLKPLRCVNKVNGPF